MSKYACKRTFVRFSRSVQLFLHLRATRTPKRSCIAPKRHSYRASAVVPVSQCCFLRLSPDFFMSSRDNSATEKFRSRFDRHDSQVLAPRGLISINCAATPPPSPPTTTRDVLQGGSSARRTRHHFLWRQWDIRILYGENNGVNIAVTCTNTCAKLSNILSNASNIVIF